MCLLFFFFLLFFLFDEPRATSATDNVWLGAVFEKKARAFKVPESWEPMDLDKFKVGLDLSPLLWPVDVNDKVASGTKATKVMMTLASNPVMRPSPSFNAGMKKNKGVEHLEYELSIIPKFGY